MDARILLEERIELLNKVWIQAQECRIESLVETVAGLFGTARYGEFLQELVGLPLLEEVAETVILCPDSGNLAGKAFQELDDVLLLDGIGTGNLGG